VQPAVPPGGTFACSHATVGGPQCEGGPDDAIAKHRCASQELRRITARNVVAQSGRDRSCDGDPIRSDPIRCDAQPVRSAATNLTG
jgi:hypothetical protein